jgi:hypothetical protein
MEFFICQIELILPIVGMKVLIPAALHSRAFPVKSSGQSEYRICSRELRANMIESSEGFVVLTGSQASAKTSTSMSPGWLNIRQKLLDAGVLKPKDERLVFTENAIFSSPSAASSVVLGRQAPGPISWVLEDGRTYKNVQEEQSRS